MKIFKVIEAYDKYGNPKPYFSRSLHELIGRNYRWLERSLSRGSKLELVAEYKKRQPNIPGNDVLVVVDDAETVKEVLVGGERC